MTARGKALPRLGPAAAAALLLAHAGCSPYATGVHGAHATPPSAGVPWTPPAKAAPLPRRDASAAVPADLAERLARLTLGDVVDLALRNNSATAASWASARAAAASYAAERRAYLPEASLEGSVTRLKSAATQGRSAVTQTIYSPAATLSYLLFDFGGRSGSVDAARQTLLAADWTHNATIQGVVLLAEQGYFRYLGTKALLAAQRATLAEAETNLDAATERHRLGLATLGDVLQARTAHSQARLALESTEGDLMTTRGALASSMGLPANLPYDVEAVPDSTPVFSVADSVDTLIDRGLAVRPDLSAAWALARAARARVAATRADGLPSINLSGSAGKTYVNTRPRGSDVWSGSASVSVPLFPGLTHRENVKEAQAEAEALEAKARGLSDQVVYEVYSSYYAVRTATQRVRTSQDLLASARQSEEVALARYKAGAGSALDLLSAQSALADARAQSIDARFGWYSSLAQLAHDAGILGIDGKSPLRLEADTTETSP
ncbi:MAG TPA: TolC family protein [Candidatus Eisenbacteria bacterium]